MKEVIIFATAKIVTSAVDSGELKLKGIRCLEYLFAPHGKKCLLKIGVLDEIERGSVNFDMYLDFKYFNDVSDFFKRADFSFQALNTINEFIEKHFSEENKEKRKELRSVIDTQIKILKKNMYI